MQTESIAVQRMAARYTTVPGTPRRASASQTASVLKELEAAKKFVKSVSLVAHTRLSEDDKYELTAAEGLIAGAIKKLEAAGVTS